MHCYNLGIPKTTQVWYYYTKIKSENYHLIDLDNPREITKINEKILTEDGHPQISEDGKYLVTDTYANQEGFQKG